jgi:FdhD protein
MGSYIKEVYQNLDLVQKLRVEELSRQGKVTTREETVLVEHLMDVYINERLTMKLICTPEYLTELVLGRLLTEGIITSTQQIELLYICTHGSRAKVTLKDRTAAEGKRFVEVTPSCCTGNHILNDYFAAERDLKPVTPIDWKPEWVFALADRLGQGMPLHSETFATHSCFLAQGEQFLFGCEDIGRHNALDKAIGYGLRHDIDLKTCIAYSSGRIPTDMVEKVIRAGIPVFASKAAPTQEAIALAKAYGVTLICGARSDRMKQYTP